MGDDAKHFPPHAGKIPFAVGQSAVVRIPVPGTDRLAVEFRSRGWIPPTGSTSTLFSQDPIGRRHLRLDYGFNERTKTIDYHWNQRGVHSTFGISGHTPTGRAGAIAYQGAKYFRFVGRTLIVVGAALDIVSIVHADRPLRRASEAVTGWAGAWLGCKAVGAGGAYAGTAVEPGLGTAAGGVLGCIVGGVGGYIIGETLAGGVYDWAEGTYFTRLGELREP